ncbi:MAG: tyrosine-type recombinase/integrase [Treponemataceae bacterium]|nr:tyrosine-type recombinase/integrase [Treponemataceae bacterium]
MRPFYIFKRAGNNYYAQFHDPVTHRCIAVRSMGTKNKEEALAKAWSMFSGIQKKEPQESEIMGIINTLSRKSYRLEEIAMLQTLIQTKYPELRPAVSAQSVTASTVPDILEHTAFIPQKKTPLLKYIADFWDFEKSDYVQDKLAHGQRIGKRHCYEQANLVKYWREFFTDDATLEELTVTQLREFERYLQKRHENTVLKNSNGKPITPLSTATMKNIIRCGGISFGWAVKQGYISSNPEDALTQYSTVSKERGILSAEEARELFKHGQWEDERYRVASLLAMITGMRLGEIQALRRCDIGDDMIYVRRAWSPVDGLKCPKNGKERKVPLPPEVRKELLDLVSKNPHKNMFAESDGFVFWGTMPDKPLVSNQITEGFKNALHSIGITEKMREERNIVFHSWRHFYATTIAHDVDEKHAQMVLGHETPAMTKHYADHQRAKDLEEMTSITNALYKKLMA